MNQVKSSPASQRRRQRPRRRAALALRVVPATFGICRLAAHARVPSWVHSGVLSSIRRSPDELSIVCEERLVPEWVRCERDWRAIRVLGPLDLGLIGVLATLAVPLARAKISLFSISTFDTDYLLVRGKNLSRAVAVLEEAGNSFDDAPRLPAETAEESIPESAEPVGPPPDAALGEQPAVAGEPVAAAGEAAVDDAPAAAGEPVMAAESPAEPTSVERRGGALRERVTRALDDLARNLGRRQSEAREDEPASTSEPAPASASLAEPEVAPVEEVVEAAAEPRPEPAPAREPEPVPDAPEAVPAAPEAPAEVPKLVVGAEEGARSDGLFTGAIPQHPVETVEETFADLGLSPPILATVRAVGFEHPTPIQAGVIPVALSGGDVIGLAETGSGKTAAFSLPLAERLTHGRGIRGLILCPTREIALQTKSFLDIFGRDHELESAVVIGGVGMRPQIDALRRTPDIIVATPGRLADHLRRRNVRLDKLQELVLDEADHMLDLGFLPQIREILEQVPDERHTMMFSATMPTPIERLAQQFMRDPERVDFRPSGQVASGIEHRLYLVKEDDMKKCLFRLLEEVDGSTLIFSRRKLHTEWLARQIEQAGFQAARIHSDRSQAQRVQALRGFREGHHRILVATDVAARGIDVPRIQHVVNYGLPEATEDYVHRAGRTARGNAAGIVSSIGTWQDKLTVREIELTLGITIPRCSVEGVEAYTELPRRKMVRRRRLL